jgi:peroxiredoxin (alkyl hydroperoxide reductase subunit C)
VTAVAVRYEKIKALGAEVLYISTDKGPTLKAWHEHELSKMVEGGIPFPLISDETHAIGRAYGVLEEESGRTQRSRFLIDPEGVLQTFEVLGGSVGRNTDEIVRLLQAFRHVEETGEVTPADWQPGDTTLTPSPEMMGHVWELWKPE